MRMGTSARICPSAKLTLLSVEGGLRSPGAFLAPYLRLAGLGLQLLEQFRPRHFPEKLIPLIILNALEGKPLPVYGKGENVRDWLDVEDHARIRR